MTKKNEWALESKHTHTRIVHTKDKNTTQQIESPKLFTLEGMLLRPEWVESVCLIHHHSSYRMLSWSRCSPLLGTFDERSKKSAFSFCFAPYFSK
jgi:hypothetical protein